MTSAIDASKPTATDPTTQSVRDNFQTAKNEITALQNDKTAAADLADTTNVANGDALVGGKRTDANAVAYTIHDFNESRVKNAVVDFGVDTAGTESANATAIQNALDLGGDVFLPSGTYDFTSFTLSGNTRLYGEGFSTVVRLSSATGILLKNQQNILQNMKITVQPTTSTTSLIVIKTATADSGTTSSYDRLTDLWIEGASKGQVGIDFQSTDKPSLWNFFNNLVIRDVSNAINFTAVAGDGTKYNNTNIFTNIDIHTCTNGIVFGVGDNDANLFNGLDIGEAATNEITFSAADSASRTIITNYVSWDFLGATRIAGNSLGGIIQGDGTTRLYAMTAGDFSTKPLILDRADSAGSVFQQFKNTAKTVNLGLNTGKSGSPLHVDTAFTAGGVITIEHTTTTGLDIDRTDAAGNSQISVGNTSKSVLFGIDAGKTGSPFGIQEDTWIDGLIAITDGITAPAATAGYAKLFIDTADGDLKIIFGDGTTKTIVVDT